MNGSAVMKAVDPNGHTWEYDNDSLNWVNLQTGQSLTPKEFASYAGGSGDAARNTSRLADEMRREEAALTGQVLPPRGPSPVPASAGTQGLLPAPAPVAPQNFVAPETMARVIAQRPTASVQPPSGPQDWIQAYTKDGQLYSDRMMQDFSNINRLQALMELKKDPSKLNELWPLLMNRGAPPQTRTASMQFHANGVFDPVTGAWKKIEGIPEPEPGKVEEVTREGRKYRRVTQPSGVVTESPLRESPELESLRSLEKTYALAAEKAADPATEVKLSRALEAVRAQIDRLTQVAPKTPPARAMVTAPAISGPGGKEIKDKDGKVWIYTGNSANPLTDRDQSHWTPK